MRAPSRAKRNTPAHNATFKQNKQQQQKSQTGAQFKLRLFCLSRRAGLQLTVDLLLLLLLFRRRQLQFFTYSTDTSLSSAAAVADAWLPNESNERQWPGQQLEIVRVAAIKLHSYRLKGYHVCHRYRTVRSSELISSSVAALACRDYANVRANAMPKLTARSPAEGSNPPIILRCNMVHSGQEGKGGGIEEEG